MTEAPALRPGRLVALLAVFAGACGGPEIPEVGSDGMEPAVREAIRGARDALAADRSNAAAWGRFGMVLHAHRLGAAAGLAYAEAARLDEDDHRWPHLHGRLLETAEPPRALGLADEALRRNPRFAPALALRARVLEGMGDDDGAEAAWEALRDAAPGSVEAPLALGRRRLRRGDLPARVPPSSAWWNSFRPPRPAGPFSRRSHDGSATPKAPHEQPPGPEPPPDRLRSAPLPIRIHCWSPWRISAPTGAEGKPAPAGRRPRETTTARRRSTGAWWTNSPEARTSTTTTAMPSPGWAAARRRRRPIARRSRATPIRARRWRTLRISSPEAVGTGRPMTSTAARSPPIRPTSHPARRLQPAFSARQPAAGGALSP